MSNPYAALGQERYFGLDHEIEEISSPRSLLRHAYSCEPQNDVQAHTAPNAVSTENLFNATKSDRRPSTSTPFPNDHNSSMSPEDIKMAGWHYHSEVMHHTLRHKLKDRIGTYLLYMNIGALILLFGSISALSFLWFGGHGNTQWRGVMIHGWIGQAVTLSTIAIRLALATQASTAISMIASITMESSSRGGVLVYDAPALSIARYTNPGPLVFFPTLMQNAWSTRRSLVIAVAFVLAFTTLVAQFTSTLLLWDVRTSVTRGFPQITNITVGIDMEDYVERFQSTMALAEDYWVSSQTFATFAEWNEQPKGLPESIVDTGPTVRAFLPVASALDRSMLREYEGVAAAFDARVACVRPVFDNWRINSSEHTVISGNLHAVNLTDDLQQMLRHNQNSSGMSFSCLFDDLDTLTDPMFKICSLSYTEGGLINQLDPTCNNTLNYHYDSVYNYKQPYDEFKSMSWVASHIDNDEIWPVELGHTFLILSSRGNTTLSVESGFTNTFGPDSGNFTLKNRGPWVDFFSVVDSKLPTNVSGQLSMTLCYDALPNPADADRRLKHVQDFPIKATRLSNYSDPVLEWDSSRRAFNTTSVRVQLGATANTSSQARGIFDMDISIITDNLNTLAQQWSPSHNNSFNDMRLSTTLWFLNTTLALPEDTMFADTSSYFANFTSSPHGTYDYLNALLFWRLLLSDSDEPYDHFELYAPCENCTYYSVVESVSGYPEDIKHTVLHPMLNAIFRDTLLETDNPALAYQALMTTIMGTAYYDWIPAFDSKEKMTTASMVACQLPLHSKGFAIAMGNICLHLVFVVITALWFTQVTKYSLLNNAWQVVAQLQGPYTEKLMQESTMLEDKAVTRNIKDQGFKMRRRLWLQETNNGGVYIS